MPVSSQVNNKHRQLVTLIATSMNKFANIKASSSSCCQVNLTTFIHSCNIVTLFFLDTFKRSHFGLLIMISAHIRYKVFEQVLSEKIFFIIDTSPC